MKMPFLSIAIAAFVLSGSTVQAVDYSTALASGKKVTVCRVDLRKQRLQLFLKDDEGRTLKSFEAIERWLTAKKQKLVFGMNAGMYHEDRTPVGLYVEAGKQHAPLNLRREYGNFFLKPNGVFLIGAGGAAVVESSRYPMVSERVELATQSGPLLVLDGRIHPAFKQDSDSRLLRNGVGVRNPQEAIFAITNEPTNLYEFAAFFRDVLKCPNALFFDGTVSSIHSPELKRSDKLIDLGPIIGITE